MEKFLFGFWISVSWISSGYADCQPSFDRCNFYRECVEAGKPCGSEGYALGYGERNCDKFLRLQKTLNLQGQMFLSFTRSCLQNQLAIFLARSEYTCEDIRQFAFESHPFCYTQQPVSICRLDKSDLSKIIRHFDVTDIIQRETLNQMAQISMKCFSETSF